MQAMRTISLGKSWKYQETLVGRLGAAKFPKRIISHRPLKPNSSLKKFTTVRPSLLSLITTFYFFYFFQVLKDMERELLYHEIFGTYLCENP
jgi:hypothetical protein